MLKNVSITKKWLKSASYVIYFEMGKWLISAILSMVLKFRWNLDRLRKLNNKESLVDKGDGGDEKCDKRRKNSIFQYYWERYALNNLSVETEKRTSICKVELWFLCTSMISCFSIHGCVLYWITYV